MSACLACTRVFCMTLEILLLTIGGYLSGSVLYAYLIPYLLCGIDIREASRDGNPGTANVFRICGAKVGTLVAAMEFAKAFVPVAAALSLLDQEAAGCWFALIILAPVFGHMYSVLNLFRGGVGIAAAFGTMIAIFLETRLLIVAVLLYVIGRFGIHFKRDLYRTDFVFLTFLLILQVLHLNPAYRLAYSIISVAVLFKNHFLKTVYAIPAGMTPSSAGVAAKK